MHHPSRKPSTLPLHAGAAAPGVRRWRGGLAARFAASAIDTARRLALRLTDWLHGSVTLPMQPRPVPVRVRTRRR
ncbi:hypothetical protein [Ralstonia pseudosolanacearum]|uniref:Uncharacterized protein n=1 Tax=Ralstonia solanacearum TaxID=305 RepID=A0AA92EI89_RALSL|nr:hypothetical protein [Ralstonia pseudosolanacearum]QCX51700.1 hypothetical protein E7Z57_22070 [Ralstonia pseudosolanacearum]